MGKEPFGTLASTDVYSLRLLSIYLMNHTLPGFAIENLYVSQTARTKNKLSHVFIQLYAGGNAWREPTGDELNFMTVFALMNGSMTSYYETKSNSRKRGTGWLRSTATSRPCRRPYSSIQRHGKSTVRAYRAASSMLSGKEAVRTMPSFSI